MTYALATTLLVLLLTGEWVMTLFSLPGNWLMVVTFAGFAAWAYPLHGAASKGWIYAGVLAALALAGELIELGASAAGVAKGGSKRGAVLAMIGALIGSIVGAGLGVPIPVVGSVVGVLLGASAGAMAGAMLGETWKGKGLADSAKIGTAAFLGRLLGTGAKLICGAIMAAVATLVALLPG
jgi:uncharacterized protein YqgC (DUF456 family)